MAVPAYEQLDACPLCGASSTDVLIVTDAGHLFDVQKAVMCIRCSLVYQTPRIAEAALANYYLGDAFSRDFRTGEVPDEQAQGERAIRANERWEKVSFLLPRGHSTLLEIGCSSGAFLNVARANGFETWGIDPSTGYANVARQGGHHVTVGHFPEDLLDDRLFDVIAMFHVVEHVPDPAHLLSAVRARLAPNGIAIIEYPDLGQAAMRPVIRTTYFQRSHLFDFTSYTLGVFLGRAALEVVHRVTGGLPPDDKNVTVLLARGERHEPSEPPSALINGFHACVTGRLAAPVSEDFRQPRARRYVRALRAKFGR